MPATHGIRRVMAPKRAHVSTCRPASPAGGSSTLEARQLRSSSGQWRAAAAQERPCIAESSIHTWSATRGSLRYRSSQRDGLSMVGHTTSFTKTPELQSRKLQRAKAQRLQRFQATVTITNGAWTRACRREAWGGQSLPRQCRRQNWQQPSGAKADSCRPKSSTAGDKTAMRLFHGTTKSCRAALLDERRGRPGGGEAISRPHMPRTRTSAAKSFRSC
mmetsp:Transcript_64338/g.199230  ORF Transcript_64338/g.199230 Transcript_64338/m.199230 type:complete len:218 (+) Transcript_64338:265-918(+)